MGLPYDAYADKLPSIGKGRHGFDGQKCPHTASSPLGIRQYSLRVFPCLGTFLLRQNCKAPASDEFTSDFWLLRRRRADARQGEKGKKRRKDTLAGVSALVNRWYRAGIAAQLKMSLICFSQRKENSAASGRDARPLRCPLFTYVVMSAVLLLGRMSAGHFLQRQRKVTICALVQSALGLNVVLVVPLVMSSLAAHRTASA